MKRALSTFLFLMTSPFFRKFLVSPLAHLEITRLKMSLAYVRSIKTFRLLFLSLLVMGICLVFLFTGLVLFHVALFLYAPWSAGTKFIVGLSCSAVYLLIALGAFYEIFSQSKWLKIFHADTITDHLHKEEHKDNSHPQRQPCSAG